MKSENVIIEIPRFKIESSLSLKDYCNKVEARLVSGSKNQNLIEIIGDEENRSKGYGTEAMKLLVDYGFNILGLHNIDLNVFEFNKQAIKAYEKVGFKEYGRRHESYFLDGKFYDEISMEIINERN